VKTNAVGYAREAENGNFIGSIVNSSSLSNGQGVSINSLGQSAEFSFTLNQDVPRFQLFVGIFSELNNWNGTVTFFFDGDPYLTETFGGVSQQNNTSGQVTAVNSTSLDGGTRHTLRAETTAVSGGDYIVDALYAFDRRSKFNIDTPTSNSFNGNSYTEPQLFPDNQVVNLADFNTRRLLTELDLVQSWNNVDNNAAVRLRIGSQDSGFTLNLSLNANGQIERSFAVNQSDAARNGNIDIRLSRFSSGNNTIPVEGDRGQVVDFHTVDGNPSAINQSNIGEARTRGFFDSGVLTGNTIREGGQLAGSDLLTHSVFADIAPEDDNIIPSEELRFIPE
jgi:hypothetical protein